jgi:multiple sugar transport system permease protein
MQAELNNRGPARIEPGPENASPSDNSPLKHQAFAVAAGLNAGAERLARSIFVWPAVLALLFLSIFPLLVSLYLSLTKFELATGGFSLKFIGLENYRNFIVGGGQREFLGAFGPVTIWHWLIFGLALLGLAAFLWRYVRSSSLSIGGLIGRVLLVLGLALFVWLFELTLGPGGRLGTLGITVVYVFVGIFFQFVLGLGLALLVIQHLPGRRFFRVVFLLPMMITPVGVAYMFRMLTDTGKGPLTPLWQGFGLVNFSWVTNPWGARIAILIGDIWQWTPFMFIVLVAALESQSLEPLEAAIVDGANDWQLFRYITWPEILPVSLTLILIRLIEAFKIIDLPNVMTNGGPGISTESLTLQAYTLWRNIDIGGSAAVAYMLLIAVTFFSMLFVNLIRHRAVAEL